MSPFRPKGRTIWRLKVPNRQGGWADKSTGTRDKLTANAMERMIRDLGPQGKREWDLLDAVHDGRVSLGDLFDAHRMGDLQGLRARLDDVDLSAYLDRWQAWLVGRVTPEGAAKYLGHVRTYLGASSLRSAFTRDAVDRWMAGISRAPATKRRYFAALESFVAYLTAMEVLTTSPLRGLRPPPPPLPEPDFLSLEEAQRVVQAAEEPYRTLFAFLYGSGCDLTPALRVCRRDVFTDERSVRARGKKSRHRDRIVAVSEWAWPYIEARCNGLLPDAPLFLGVSRWTASDVHRAILKRLGLNRKGIRLHAARHHYAVRMLRTGTPVELVAQQLGNDPGTCLKYYGRFIPTTAERQAWERRASAQDRKRGIAPARIERATSPL